MFFFLYISIPEIYVHHTSLLLLIHLIRPYSSQDELFGILDMQIVFSIRWYRIVCQSLLKKDEHVYSVLIQTYLVCK